MGLKDSTLQSSCHKSHNRFVKNVQSKQRTKAGSLIEQSAKKTGKLTGIAAKAYRKIHGQYQNEIWFYLCHKNKLKGGKEKDQTRLVQKFIHDGSLPFIILPYR